MELLKRIAVVAFIACLLTGAIEGVFGRRDRSTSSKLALNGFKGRYTFLIVWIGVFIVLWMMMRA